MIMSMYTGIVNNLNGNTDGFNLPWWGAILLVIGMLVLVVLIVFIQNSERRIPCSMPSGWWAARCTAASPATSP